MLRLDKFLVADSEDRTSQLNVFGKANIQLKTIQFKPLYQDGK